MMMKIRNDQEKVGEEETEYDAEENEETNDVSDLSILEKEENLKPGIIENLKSYSRQFKKIQKN